MEANTQYTKPIRSQFYKLSVLDSNGTVISEDVWKPIVGEITELKLAKRELRKHGWQFVRVFMRTQYYDERHQYQDSLKSAKVVDQIHLIANAFERAECKPEPHVVRALKVLTPLVKGLTQNKTISLFRNVIRAVDHTTGHSLHA